MKPSNEATEQSVAESKDNATSIRVLHVLILGGLSAIGPLSTDMYLPSLPTISHDLSATMSQTQVTLSAGILGLALGQVISGPLSDRLGRRRPLLIGLAAFALASLLCTVAPSITALTGLRSVQGIAGASLLVVVLSGIGLVGVLPSFFVEVASLGLIAPNATALALANINTRIAGSASALLGVLQFSIGAIAAPLIGLGGNATAVPMAAFIAMFTTAALVTFIVLCHPAQAQARASRPTFS